ncbi:MAG: hypothetical protein ACP5EP_07340 [Acidobacteriaceae bacterium]
MFLLVVSCVPIPLALAQTQEQPASATPTPGPNNTAPPIKTHDTFLPEAPSSSSSTPPTPGTTSGPPSAQSQHSQAEQQVQQQEHQRILGIIPNFNTSFIQNAAPLTPGQKFRLAFKSATDPFYFLAAAVDAGYSQATDAFPGYGQGAQGYGKRFGAAYADSFDGAILGNALFPVLLHEDPRYFRKGTGSFKNRFLYAIATTVITKNDNGTWGPNYANVLGNVAAGGISNLYYPSTDRGVALTFERAATVTAEGAIGAIFVEFWPDISHKLFHKGTRP